MELDDPPDESQRYSFHSDALRNNISWSKFFSLDKLMPSYSRAKNQRFWEASRIRNTL